MIRVPVEIAQAIERRLFELKGVRVDESLLDFLKSFFNDVHFVAYHDEENKSKRIILMKDKEPILELVLQRNVLKRYKLFLALKGDE